MMLSIYAKIFDFYSYVQITNRCGLTLPPRYFGRIQLETVPSQHLAAITTSIIIHIGKIIIKSPNAYNVPQDN